MDILLNILITTILISNFGIAQDVCSRKFCQCFPPSVWFTVNCDNKHLKNLNDITFPSSVGALTLIENQLQFDSVDDRLKIENLPNLIDLSINQNPLGTIPPFNNTKLQSLSLQDTSLTSAIFPSSYNTCSSLQTIILSGNKIRSINENDFSYLRNTKLHKLHVDSSSISTIDQNAFIPLTALQSLSLKNNQLKSCEFIKNIPLLSSINFDGNQFTSLPQELSTPNYIKMYSFMNNFITVIDDSSPLNKWTKMNLTNIKINLINNSFDCCLSLWFIRFLKTSSQYVADAKLLTCTKPSEYAGKFLMNLNPDEMNCDGNIPTKSWWTIGRIIGIIIGFISLIIVIIIIIFILKRRRSSRSGYTEIGGIDDPYDNIDAASSTGPVFPIADEDIDDGYSTTSYIPSTRSFPHSEVPTNSGASAIDGSRVGAPETYGSALLPPC